MNIRILVCQIIGRQPPDLPDLFLRPWYMKLKQNYNGVRVKADSETDAHDRSHYLAANALSAGNYRPYMASV